MKTTTLFGAHSVRAVIDYAPEKIVRVWVEAQRQDKRLTNLVADLHTLGIDPEVTDRKKLDRLANGQGHQGIVAEVHLPELLPESALKDAVLGLTKPALFLILDNVQDPHNLGACLRTCEAAGATGIIITKDNSVGITPTVCKVASGAAETLPVYQVTNLARTLRWLKQQGIWIAGAAGEAENIAYCADFTISLALVIGAEGTGLRRLTREECDFLVKLPILGKMESLNLSVAAGILLYEAVRQRQFKN